MLVESGKGEAPEAQGKYFGKYKVMDNDARPQGSAGVRAKSVEETTVEMELGGMHSENGNLTSLQEDRRSTSSDKPPYVKGSIELKDAARKRRRRDNPWKIHDPGVLSLTEMEDIERDNEGPWAGWEGLPSHAPMPHFSREWNDARTDLFRYQEWPG